MTFLWLLLIPVGLFLTALLVAALVKITDLRTWWSYPLYVTLGICVAIPAFVLSILGPVALVVYLKGWQ
jgi:hypothetical protein